MGMMIRILVPHDRSFAGMLSAMIIEIDGEPVSRVRRGGRASFELPRGDHTITAKMNTMRSQPVAIGANGRDDLRFNCGCRGYGEALSAWLWEAGFEHWRF
jgi:hypothetical protein